MTACLLLLGAGNGLADDVGITKARLVQKTEKSYVLEADITRMLVWAIKAPIFPDRFQVSELTYINQAGWIVVQATATTTGKALSPEDEILLPWMRNGTAMTVQWLDGKLQQGLFLRSLDGIHVPMRLLMPPNQGLADIVHEQVAIGLRHLTFTWVHILLVAILVCAIPSRGVFSPLLAYTFGQGISLLLSDLGLPGFDLLMTELLGLVLIFLLARAAVHRSSVQPFFPLLFFFGLLHGLSYFKELTALDANPQFKTSALFMFNLTIDIGHYTAALLLLNAARLVGKLPHRRIVVSTVIGALSVAVLVVMFQQHVMVDRAQALAGDGRIATSYSLPVSQNTLSSGQRPRGARRLTSPVMSYLTVEPEEVRQELLIQARVAVQFLGIDDTGKGSIPIESLEPVKKRILAVVQEANPIFIDGQPAEPVVARADFVTLGPAGVFVRPEPVSESLDNGIIGVSLVYETQEMADEILIDWHLFSETVPRIEATATDPFGGATRILSPDANRWVWNGRLSGYRVPVIEEIAVQKRRLPAVSIVLFVLAAGLFTSARLRGKISVAKPVLVVVALVGFGLYPFVGFPVEVPWLTRWTPSVDRSTVILEGLLTNVYRAFDVRDEDRVYDRLAMSVTGGQLARIYLQNRRSLALEDRGGARANVDKVDILAIESVKRSKDKGFVADTVWTVSGSVSHYGHTHYRRNKNHALVTFVADGHLWKIKGIELIEEKRLM